MSLWSDLGKPPEKDFPNHLLDPAAAPPLPRRDLLLAGLLLVCFATRAWMAWKWEIVCRDATVYLETAKGVEQGDYSRLLRSFGLNVYPMILALLHAAGLPWRVAGEWWSVLMATAAVLPLFGWVRRQFNDRVAALGCLLYALHPKLVYISPLILRDATFWFLLQLALYFGWRAVIEIRLRLFVAAGVALSLAIHTRSEGLLLLIPLGLWAVWRMPAVAGRRTHLVAGMILSGSMIPAWIVLINVTLLHDHPRWVLVRSRDVELAKDLLIPGDRPEQAPPQVVPTGRQLITTPAKLGVRLVKAYTYLYGILVLLGLWGWRRVFLRRDQQALFLLSVGLCVLTWGAYTRGTEIDMRYYFPCLLTTFAYVALALLNVAEWITRLTSRRLAWSPPRRAALVVGMLVAILLAGAPDRALSRRQRLYQQADLGKWIRRQVGPNQRIVGCLDDMRMVTFFAQGELVHSAAHREYVGRRVLRVIEVRKPDVAVLFSPGEEHRDVARWAAIIRQHPELGFRCVPQCRLPPGCRQAHGEALILLKTDAQPSRGSDRQ